MQPILSCLLKKHFCPKNLNDSIALYIWLLIFLENSQHELGVNNILSINDVKYVLLNDIPSTRWCQIFASISFDFQNLVGRLNFLFQSREKWEATQFNTLYTKNHVKKFSRNSSTYSALGLTVVVGVMKITPHHIESGWEPHNNW